jgi:glycine cleavage system protein P-like pyridoxal-binding family
MDSKKDLLRFEEAYSNVMALYATLKDQPSKSLRNESAIDFFADVEIKARRILPPTIYAIFLRMAYQGVYDVLPTNLKQDLGKEFIKRKMNIDGDYRVLYYKAKNQRLHESIMQDRPSFPEEEVTPEDILDGI